MEWDKVFGIALIVAIVLGFIVGVAILASAGGTTCPEGQKVTTITTFNAALKIPTTLTFCTEQ